MNYPFGEDISIVQQLLGISDGSLASEIHISRSTLQRAKNHGKPLSEEAIERFYGFAYSHDVMLNKVKELYYRDVCINNDTKLLFHGSKNFIDGKLSLEKSKPRNDFGKGFYCGESFVQSAMFSNNFKSSSVYMIEYDPNEKLRCLNYKVDNDWMLTIAYFRGQLEQYKGNPKIQALVARAQEADCIVAPIADNRMYATIGQFVDGSITDIQCCHCLSSCSLGMQYVFTSETALDHVRVLERRYICRKERDGISRESELDWKARDDKVKLALKRYRRQGRYFDEIFGE